MSMDKLENIKKQKMNAYEIFFGMEKIVKKMDHDEKIIEQKLVEINGTNVIWFTKKDLLNTISFLDTPDVLKSLICDYGYHARYIKYGRYKPAHCDKRRYYNDCDSTTFNDYLVEYANGMLYISNIFTGKMFDIINFCDNIQPCGRHFKCTFDKLYIIDKKDLHRILFEKDKCRLIKENNEEFKRIIKVIDENGNSIFERAVKKSSLDLCSLGDDINLREDRFNVDENNHLSILAYSYKISEYDVPYVLEYDLTRKHIIDMYKIETNHIPHVLEYDLTRKHIIDLYKIETNHIPHVPIRHLGVNFNRNRIDIEVNYWSASERVYYTYVKCIV